MRTKLLSALVAAMTFSAVGCTDNPRKASSTAPPPRVELRSAPKVEGPLVRPAPPKPVVAVEPVEPKELLAMEHEDGRAIDHLSRAAVLQEQGDVKGALAEARRAVFDAPEDADAVETCERLARAAGDRAVRLLALDRIAELRTDDATPLIQKARVQLALKDYAGAVRTGHDAAKRDGSNPEVYQAIGRGHLSLGQLAPAIAMFQKVVQLDPNHGYGLNNLGFAYLRANQNHDAVDVLTRAAELLPKVAWVHNNLGVALERTGRTDEARQAYLDASFLSPKYVKAQVNVARVASLSAAADDATPPDSLSDIPLEAYEHED